MMEAQIEKIKIEIPKSFILGREHPLGHPARQIIGL